MDVPKLHRRQRGAKGGLLLSSACAFWVLLGEGAPVVKDSKGWGERTAAPNAIDAVALLLRWELTRLRLPHHGQQVLELLAMRVWVVWRRPGMRDGAHGELLRLALCGQAFDLVHTVECLRMQALQLLPPGQCKCYALLVCLRQLQLPGACQKEIRLEEPHRVHPTYLRLERIEER